MHTKILPYTLLAAFFATVSLCDFTLTAARTPYRVSTAELQGPRPTMEDALVTVQKGETYFFAVYDGHGGDLVANLAAGKLPEIKTLPLHKRIFNRLAKNMSPHDAITQSVATFDKEVKAHITAHETLIPVGSCAIMTLVTGNTLYTANIGDSRAVLCRKGEAIPLSFDQKPLDPAHQLFLTGVYDEQEFARCQAAGAKLKPPMQDPVTGQWRPARVANLAISRALGDFNPTSNKKPKGVISLPTITTHELTSDDDFLILACDGLWDVMSSQEAVDLVNRYVHDQADFDFLATRLALDALQRGSTDNISIIIVDLGYLRDRYAMNVHTQSAVERIIERLRSTQSQSPAIAAPQEHELEH